MLIYIYKNSRIAILFSFITSFVCLYKSSEVPEGYEYLWLIPFLYSVCLSISEIRKYFFSFLGLSIFNLILFVRYVLTPLFSSISGLFNHSQLVINSSYNNQIAVLLMIMEMILLFIALNFSVIKLNKIKKINIQALNIRNNNFIYLLFGSIGVLGYFFIPAISERTNFLLMDEVEIYNLSSFASLIFFFTLNASNLFFLWILSSYLYKNNKGNLTYKVLLLFMAFISISVVSSSSRLTILAKGLAIIALLNFTKSLSKKSLNLLGFTTIIVILSITSFWLFGFGEIS